MLTRKNKLLISIFLLALIYFGYNFYQSYKTLKKEPIQSWSEDINSDCAIVLTGGAHRTREGFDLLAHKQIKKLIISGVYEGAQLAEIMPVLSFYPEINSQDVVLEKRSTSTYGNAQQTLPIVEALHCNEVILITSFLHMSRAYKTFRASYPEKISLIRYSVPAGRGEMAFADISTEVLKTLFYSLWAF